jgi:arylsulfatase A-like enzyme
MNVKICKVKLIDVIVFFIVKDLNLLVFDSGLRTNEAKVKIIKSLRYINERIRNKVTLFFCLTCCTLSFVHAADDKPMNILYIMSDDHATTAIGSYGARLSALNPTPTLDKLANKGTLFENVFVTNSVCTPSRASILTGQYSHINGARNLGAKLAPEKQFLPLEMKKSGYETAVIGKWHISSEPAAFDHYEVLEGQGKYFNPTFNTKSDVAWPKNQKQYQGHSSDVITDRSLQWLKNRKSDKPFLLLHHFKAPHGMFENAPRYDDYLAEVNIPEPKTLFDQQGWGSIATRGENDTLRPLIGSSVSKRHTRNIGKNLKVDQKLSDEAYTKEAYQGYLKRYLRCVKGVDDNIQRLLDYLEESGQAENTIVIYSSDQGFMLGEHDLIDKRWMYEESLRMPLIIYHPKLKQIKRSKQIINNTDFAPTMLAMAGAEKTPDYMQGYDFSAALTGKKSSNERQSTYYRYWMHMRHHANPAHFGIRTEQYKLILFYGQPESTKVKKQKKKKKSKKQPSKEALALLKGTPVGWELYDINADPEETVNLYNNPEYKAVIKNLKQELVQLRKDVQENDVDYPHIQQVITQHWKD